MKKDEPKNFYVINKKIRKDEKDFIESLLIRHVEQKRNIEKLLELLREKSYIFHGSQGFFEKLIPVNQENEFQIKAIFATTNPKKAIFYSITPRGSERRVDLSNKVYRIAQKDGRFSEGYVYVLKKKGFKKKDAINYASFGECRPIAIIKIQKNDFKHPVSLIDKERWEPIKKVIFEHYEYINGPHDKNHLIRVAENAETLAQKVVHTKSMTP
jgi:hypothetical protein